MLRSGFILSVGGSAALLTVLLHPVIRHEADLRTPARPVSGIVTANVGPTYRVAIANPVERRNPSIATEPNIVASEKPALKPRRSMRDGCEGAISSLAGPEARRMIPGRCIA